MAKIRVYELAKDLSMTNRELLKKIAELNIEVNNHMSSLDDESVKEIKSNLFGNSDKKIEEKRIHPTVIRRRKKGDRAATIDTKSSPMSLDVDGPNKNDDMITSVKSGLLDNAESENHSLNIKDDFYSETKEADAKLVSSETSSVSRSHNEKIYQVTKEAAKIISRPVAENDSSSVSIATDHIKEKIPSKRGKFRIDEPGSSEEKKGMINSTLITEGSRKVSQNDDVDTSLSNGSNDSNSIRTSGNKLKKNTSPKIIKKRDTPAKIIKKATPPKTEPKKKFRSSRQATLPERKIVRANGNEPPEASKRKGYKKRKVFKKKEIVEGSALYSGEKRGRKSRKSNRFKSSSPGQKTQITTAKAIKRRIKVDETIVLAELAKRLGIKANKMIAKLMSMGVMVTVNQTIDFDTACLVASEFNYEVDKASFEEESILKKIANDDDPEKLIQRSPVVTIMGHVDHGKTSLLDTIRKTRVTEGEIGGITQHIGAYRVETEKGVIIFLDTPGHEAFSAMRSRGAEITDLVILVVAADDGVMPQTIEAINHSKASDVPVLVAINKMDKPDASSDRVLRELSEQGLIPEEWGGDLISVEVSAKQNYGIDTLLEMVLLQAEMLDLRANPDKLAKGHVIESKLDSGRGAVATVLVQEGTLRSGDSIICGMYYGKVRALYNDMGQKVLSAGPSMPVEIVGLSGVPMAGDELVALKDEKDARQVSIHRTQKQRSKELAKTNRLSLEGLFERMQKGEVKDLNIILKADVDGSLEALRNSLIKLSNDEVNIQIVHAATGTVSESDISLAAVSNAIVIGFNVRPNAKIQDFASDERVDMRFYDIIYDVTKDVKNAIVGMMDSTYEEHILGRADVRQVFHVPKIGTIAGCYVTDGKILRGKLMRLIRDGIVVHKGNNSSLRRFKDDVKEVHMGYECGIGIENFNDIKVGDVIEAYYIEKIKPEIN